MIRRLLLISIFSSIGLATWAQSSLEGKVTDAANGEALIFANVVLFRNGNLITGTQTDLDGNYVFSSIDPGTYDVEASYTGFPTQRQTGVVIMAGKAIRLDFKLDVGLMLNTVEIVAYKVPLIEQDNTTQGGIKTAEQIRNLPTKNINAIAATTAGLSSIDGGDINIRGSRSNATDYYLDGIRVNASLIPQSEIEQLQVITGGIEARYGDVTGGLISLTSKGPSATLSGSVEAETSELTDAYGYNLLSANLSGPILKNKETQQSIIGFRASVQYRARKDPSPRAFGGYRATEEAIDSISEDPLTNINGTPIPLIERLEESDVELLKARPNVADERIDLTGKIDFKFNDEIDFTLGGNYYDYNNHFSAGRAWDLVNWQYNPYSKNNGFFVNGRFRHRIGGVSSDPDAAPALVRNISYTLQYGFEKSFGESGDDRYEDDYFEYGYVGDFDVSWVPVVGIAQDTASPFAKPLGQGTNLYGEHYGYSETFAENGYTPSPSINPLLNNYNKGQEVIDFKNYNAYNGYWSDIVNSAYAGIHTNTGAVYNNFSKNESDIHTVNLNASFDIFPGGSDKGRHNIQFGLLYEQRQTRAYSIAPIDLWNTMRFAANDAHIVGLDSMTVIGYDSLQVPINGELVTFDSICIFQTLIVDQPSLLFYKAVRDLTGQTLNEYVNIDGLNPSDLNLNMFAAEELTNRKILGYYGYDYLGNKLDFDVTFDDFFTATDGKGRRTLPVAANKPIYSAAYIQDKFTFKDIIFRLGLRVDRYDANTKVLKDPYSLYPIMEAGDFFGPPDSGSPVDNELRPKAAKDDWKVYVVSEGSTEVRAYRDGDQWYTAEGSPVNDGSEIFGNEIPNPYYVARNIEDRNIQSDEFDPDGSFEDYNPTVSWMPRLAFSFPISDEANFFVHYDILVQRPPSNTIATPLDYYYWADGPPTNNPNLKPEKTIDFEVGFKQKVSNSSAITLSAYYKELRDMIQSQTYQYVPGIPGNSYNSYGNQDFGTVKGFSFSYDLRRTQNLEMTAAYTIQFADGTGSSATSQVDLNVNGRGNLRYLSPLSFDERHRLAINLDYRYGSGNQYNGPRWFGADVFADAGISLQGNAASGRPYTKQQKPERYGASGIGGAINGARLPWNFALDMRIDKSFRISGAEGGKPLFLNVYFRMENVFDAKNEIGVYTASGSSYDDGFLATPSGQSSIQTLVDSGREEDVDNYLTSYQWGELNPGFFTLPRRAYLGAVVQF